MERLGQVAPVTPPREVSVVELLGILNRRRRLLMTFVLGLPVLTAIVMVLTPNRYTSVGTVLVETPEGIGIGSELAGQLRSLTGLSAQIPPTEMYMAILQSERVNLAVAESLSLARHWEIEGDGPEEITEKTLDRMRKRVEFESPDMVSIAIRSTDKDRRMAAAMTNALLRELEAANQELALSRARRTRHLVAHALEDTEVEFQAALEEMKSFQEEFGVFSIDKQTEGTLDLIATLQTQLLAAQTERDALGGFTSESSSRVKNLELQIEALRSQIKKIVGEVSESGDPVEVTPLASEERSESFFLPLTQLPELATEYTRLLLDVKVQEAKYNVLATQLEQTKIEESQSVPSFDILDWGRVPFRKSGPKRTLTVLAALLGGTLAGLLLAILLDDLERRVDPRTRHELTRLLRVPGVRVGRRRRAGP
jgi:uncharacterized protein involved in exopolysaccharide biosynthesis